MPLRCLPFLTLARPASLRFSRALLELLVPAALGRWDEFRLHN